MSRFVPTGNYTGAELQRRSVREGADEAAKLPSVIGGRRVLPAQLREQLRTTPPPAPVVPMARASSCVADVERPAPALPPLTPGRCGSINPYQPRHGSGPHRVLQHLQEHGGHLLYTEICARFDIAQHALTAIFKPALVRGAMIRVQVGNARALALPGYVPPVVEAPPPAPKPTRPKKVRMHATSGLPDALKPGTTGRRFHAIGVDLGAEIDTVLRGRPGASGSDSLALSLADLARTLESALPLLRQVAAALLANPIHGGQ